MTCHCWCSNSVCWPPPFLSLLHHLCQCVVTVVLDPSLTHSLASTIIQSSQLLASPTAAVYFRHNIAAAGRGDRYDNEILAMIAWAKFEQFFKKILCPFPKTRIFNFTLTIPYICNYLSNFLISLKEEGGRVTTEGMKRRIIFHTDTRPFFRQKN